MGFRYADEQWYWYLKNDGDFQCKKFKPEKKINIERHKHSVMIYVL